MASDSCNPRQGPCGCWLLPRSGLRGPSLALWGGKRLSEMDLQHEQLWDPEGLRVVRVGFVLQKYEGALNALMASKASPAPWRRTVLVRMD